MRGAKLRLKNCLQRVILVLTLLGSASCSPSSKLEGVSVVLVTIDTLRADHLGCYGATIPTPHLDELASQGSLFLDTTAQSPLTLPSHCSILTGTTPLYHNVRDNGRYQLPEQIDTLAEILKRVGYSTAAFIGAVPVHSRFGLGQGFDTYDETFPRSEKERKAVDVVTAARSWLEEREGGPFFLWVHLFDPHTPYEPPESFGEQYGDTYAGEVAYVDHALGDLFSSLGDGVLTVVTSDHGEGLGEHGEDTHALFIYDSTLSVPLIFHGPGVPRGAVHREQARSIDLVPSILELAGHADKCGSCQGKSLVALMRGESQESVASYAESYFPRLNLGWSELRSLRREGWKYIAAPEPELYDLSSDPGELTNLAKDAPEKLEEMAQELAEIEEKAGGPFNATTLTPDQETLSMLRSLGYLGSQNSPPKEGPLPDPKSRIALWQSLLKGVEHSDGGEFAQAVQEFEAVLQQDSGMNLARGYLAEALFKQGQYEVAANQCLKFLASDPNDFQANYLLGESLMRLGRVREASEALEKAAELDTTATGPLARLANLHLEMGNVAMARRALDRALERNAQDDSVLLVKGKLLLMDGKPREAEKALRDSLKANPLEVTTQVHLANLLMGLKRFAEAEEILTKGVAEQADSSVLHMTLGRVRAMSGRTEEAIESFQRALQLAPESFQAMTSLGIAYLEFGAEERGIELLERSLELNPNQPEISSFLRRRRAQ